MFLRHSCYCFLWICAIVPCTSIAQDLQKELLQTLRKADAKVQDSLYYELFKSSMKSDVKAAKNYAHKSLEIAQKNQNYGFVAKASRAVAYAYNKEGNLDSARYFYHYGIQMSQHHKLDRPLMNLLIDLGVLYDKQDTYDSALRFYNLALEIADKLDAKDGQSSIKNNIGLVFYYLNNYEEALQYLESSLMIKKQFGLLDGIPNNLMNIAIIYNDQGRYDNAITTLIEVDKLCHGDCDINIETDLNYGLGLSYLKKKEYNKSLPYLVKSYDLAKTADIKNTLAYSMYHLSDFRFRDGDYNAAIELLKESENIASQINLKRLKRDIYESYSRIFDKMGDLERVVEYQNKYMVIKDEIFNEKLASNLKDIQLDAQRKQSEVIIQQKDTEIERVRLITTLIGVISVLLVVVSILIYRNYRASHRLKKILEKEIEKRTGELVKSNADLTQMTQEYDQLVYRASHDIRGPLATLMGLTNIAKQDYEEPNRVRDYLGKIESTAMGLNQTLSQLMETNRIRNLPICIDEIDPATMVEEVYSSFRNLNHFPLISLRIEKGDWKEPLTSDKNLVAFILTKLLDNAFRYFSIHKQEKYIKVSWSQSGDKTTIAVEDNGLGINEQAREKIFQLFYVASDIHGSGLGLFLAQMAANRLGGRIILARSSGPTIFKFTIFTNLAKAEVESKPVMTVAG